MKTTLTGSCLCKSISYQIDTPPVYVANCYCSQCRKFSGSAFATIVGVGSAGLTVRCNNPDNLRTYDKSDATRLMFCGGCGSSLFAKKLRSGLVHVRLGTIDTEILLRPQAHIYVDSKAPWYDLPDDGLPRFPEAPPAALVRESMRPAVHVTLA